MNMEMGSRETNTSSREWLTAFSLCIFLISTTAFDLEIMARRVQWPFMIFLLVDIFLQGYIVWYYFYRFRVTTKILGTQSPDANGTFSWLFVIAAISVSLVALVSVFGIRGVAIPPG